MEQVWEVRWTLIAASEYEATINWLLENWNEKLLRNLGMMFGTRFND